MHTRGREPRGKGKNEMIATGKERAAGNKDKGSRRRPAGSEVHLRYHLPVFSPRYAYARAYVRASRVVTAFYPRVWRANCASRRSLYDLPSQDSKEELRQSTYWLPR